MRVLLLAILVIPLTSCFAAEGTPQQKTSDGVAVVELFTSQGCSSCPPADRLLSRIGREKIFGPNVFPLAYHVDYWNRIGWTDPFSIAQWSARQQEYAKALRSERVYSPGSR